MKFSALFLAGSLLVPMAGMAAGVNDAQIAAIVVTANQVDIDAGRLAEAQQEVDYAVMLRSASQGTD